jgi:hypothetical protein
MRVVPPHCAFVRAVVSAAKVGGVTRLTVWFSSGLSEEIAARWEAGGRGREDRDQSPIRRRLRNDQRHAARVVEGPGHSWQVIAATGWCQATLDARGMYGVTPLIARTNTDNRKEMSCRS